MISHCFRVGQMSILAASCFLLPIGACCAQDNDPFSWDRRISGLVRKYCSKCHGRGEISGDVDITRDTDVRMLIDHRETWERVRTVIQNSEMPPEKEKQPTEEERGWILTFLNKTLDELDCSSSSETGRPVLRRLNRREYDRCVNDLIGFNLHLADGFAPDATGYGFDNIGEVLSMSPVLMQQYHHAAIQIVKAIVDSKNSQPELVDRIIGPILDDRDTQREIARNRIELFASKAFRRPVDRGYVEKLMAIYDKATQLNKGHEAAQAYLIQAILMSPRFLTRIERNRPGETEVYPVDDYELASRLSFFLWSGPPDPELLDLASQNKLGAKEVRSAQVQRMLRNDQIAAIVDGFFGQWLSLNEIQDHRPNLDVNPTFDESLRSAMIAEWKLTLREIVTSNRSVLELIDADFTYLNSRLAHHYGIDGISGDEMRRVALPDRRRGGIFTSAGLLMSLSDPTRTNVPRRGNYLAGRVLGTPPPPPPPTVPTLEESSHDGRPRSLRQLLEQHRKDPTCANCHAKMDPYGFALENYDAIGAWRTHDGPHAIDPSGTLLSGNTITGPVDLKDMLFEQREAFARTLIRNLMVYAYGRGLKGSDECVVRDVMKSASENEWRFGAIVEAIANSLPFTHRRNPID